MGSAGLLSAIALPVVSLGVILATDTRWLGSVPLASPGRARLVGLMLLTEVALLVMFAPLAGLFMALRLRTPGDGLATRSPVGRLLFSAWQLARPLLMRIALMTVTSAVIVFTIRAPIDANTVLRSHVILWAAALTLATLGAVCAPMFDEPLDAAACAIGIALVVTTPVFVGGPALDSIPRWLVNASLVVNPIVATAASANIDLFRMDLLYRLSPLAHGHIEYPAASTTFAVYVLLAAVSLLLAARQFNSRVIGLSVERMSS
jgi:hypothetical protein